MSQIHPLRLHVLGHPLVKADIALVSDDGEDLAAAIAPLKATVSLDAPYSFSASFWPELIEQQDGLYAPIVDGSWRGPKA